MTSIALTYDPPTAGLNVVESAPVAVSNAAMFHRVWPPIELKLPPT